MSPLFRSDQLGRLTVEPGHSGGMWLSVPHPNPEMMFMDEGDPGVNLDRADIERLRDLCDEALA